MRITPYIAAFLVTLGLVVSTHAFADAFGEANAALNREHYETALQLLRPLAKNGDAAAQYEIGSIYENGKGVPVDSKEAVTWYLQSAAQGFPSAQYAIGGMYAEGRGVTKDFVEAVKWYRLAGDKGYLKAQLILGT